MFHLDSNADTGGTSLRDVIDLPPAFMVARFGAPEGGDNYSCTGRWIFVNDRGDVFTVYEYKSTSSYLSDECGALPPEQFWALQEPVELHIGAHADNGVPAFRQWLIAQHQLFRLRQKARP
jgi:hypothetical protein